MCSYFGPRQIDVLGLREPESCSREKYWQEALPAPPLLTLRLAFIAVCPSSCEVNTSRLWGRKRSVSRRSLGCNPNYCFCIIFVLPFAVPAVAAAFAWGLAPTVGPRPGTASVGVRFLSRSPASLARTLSEISKQTQNPAPPDPRPIQWVPLSGNPFSGFTPALISAADAAADVHPCRPPREQQIRSLSALHVRRGIPQCQPSSVAARAAEALFRKG